MTELAADDIRTVRLSVCSFPNIIWAWKPAGRGYRSRINIAPVGADIADAYRAALTEIRTWAGTAHVIIRAANKRKADVALAEQPDITIEQDPDVSALAQSATRWSQKQMQVPPGEFDGVTVGCDGAWFDTHRRYAWAWVSTDGVTHTGTGTGTRNDSRHVRSCTGAEIVAFIEAAVAHQQQRVRITSDCLAVVSIANYVQRHQTLPRLRTVRDTATAALWQQLETVVLSCCDLDVRWVPGHAGDPLNEAAHTAAWRTGRALTTGIPSSKAEKRARRRAQSATAALNSGHIELVGAQSCL
jgi:ribonuclease HI